MPLWKPDRRWAGADVYIIGGGPSLAGFDWTLLHDKNTIGCNSAFKLGPEVCKICFFSDKNFFLAFRDELAKFEGEVFTHCPQVLTLSFGLPWLHSLRREKWGLHQRAIGMGGNSGCSAVNLALIMGAKRVFLLGFDCKIEPRKPTHWHNWKIVEPNPRAYNKFMEGWQRLSADLPKVFPGCEVINLNPESAIPYFPKSRYGDYLNHGTHDRIAC